MKNKPTWYVLLTVFFCIISSFIAIILTVIALEPFATLADDGIEYLPSWSVFVIILAVFITIKLVKNIADKMFYYKPIFGKSIEEYCNKTVDENTVFVNIETVDDPPAKTKKEPQMPSYDYLLAIAKDESDWRREQSGLKPIEYELNRINGMDGTMFENWCVNLLLRSGFQTAERTGKSGDQGVDIVAVKDSIRYAIQCKCYSSPLGNTPVQEVLGGKAMYNCHVGVVMTNSTFTKGAVELAQKHGILLWDQEHIREMLEQEK